jgi:hypothetical protein
LEKLFRSKPGKADEKVNFSDEDLAYFSPID